MAEEARDLEAEIAAKAIAGLRDADTRETTLDESPFQVDQTEADKAPEEAVPAEEEVDWKKNYDELRSLENRRDQEIAELRRFKEQQEWQQQQAYVQAQQESINTDTFDELIWEDPQQAVMQAYQAGNFPLYEKAMRGWYQNDPYSAGNFQQAANLAAYQAQMQQDLQPLQEQAMASQWQTAWQNTAAQAPDVHQYGDQMMRVARENPALIESLRYDGSQDNQAKVIHTLYKIARAESGQPQAPTPVQPAQVQVPHTTSGETGRQQTASGKPLDVVQVAIRQVMNSGPKF